MMCKNHIKHSANGVMTFKIGLQKVKLLLAELTLKILIGDNNVTWCWGNCQGLRSWDNFSLFRLKLSATLKTKKLKISFLQLTSIDLHFRWSWRFQCRSFFSGQLGKFQTQIHRQESDKPDTWESKSRTFLSRAISCRRPFYRSCFSFSLFRNLSWQKRWGTERWWVAISFLIELKLNIVCKTLQNKQISRVWHKLQCTMFSFDWSTQVV